MGIIKWRKTSINTTASNGITTNTMTPINITSSASAVGTVPIVTTSSQGGTVYINPGTYTIGTPWTVTPNWVISGSFGSGLSYDYKVPGTTIPWITTRTQYVVKKELTLGLYDFMMLQYHKAKGDVVEEA